ncbi:MAG: hypothetical protein SVK08_04120 [Halobacteriota archaeon]|nr:hypothetical protein [Halobacteriota archaeon]
MNKDWIRSEVEKMKLLEQERLYVLGVIATELKKFDHKQVNKRVIDHLRNTLPKYVFTDLTEEYDPVKSFKVWGEGIKFDHFIKIRIGEFTYGNKKLDYEKIKNHLATRMGQISQFICRLDDVLNNLDDYVIRYERAVSELKFLEKLIGSTNPALKFFPFLYKLHEA